jgi:hypothetical protein
MPKVNAVQMAFDAEQSDGIQKHVYAWSIMSPAPRPMPRQDRALSATATQLVLL